MTAGPEVRTERLILRRWRDEDLEPWCAINTDPAVMEFLPGPLTPDECAQTISRIEAHFEEHGFGFWAVEAVDGPGLIGMTGLWTVSFDAPFAPAVEVGWRFAADQWGKGYATEAARASLAFGFKTLELDEIVAFTVPANRRSRAVMERIGMTHDPLGDFGHPKLPEGHALRCHVLYRARADALR